MFNLYNWPFPGSYIANDPENVRAFELDRTARDQRIYYYGTLENVSATDPAFSEERFAYWRNNNAPDYTIRYNNRTVARRSASWGTWPTTVPGAPTDPIELLGVCTGEETLANYRLWQINNLHERTGIQNIYSDTAGVRGCGNELHGHRITDAFGRTTVTFPYFERREFSERAANLIHSWGGLWVNHQNWSVVPSVHGFADFWLPGEALAAQINPTYPGVATAGGRADNRPWFYIEEAAEPDRDYYRSHFNSRISGVMTIVLPEFFRAYWREYPRSEFPDGIPNLDDYVDGLVAMSVVHDVMLSAIYTFNPGVSDSSVIPYWEHLSQFQRAEFTGYWDPDCPLSTSNPNHLASVYDNRDGSYYIAVANRDSEDATIAVDLGWLYSETHTARDIRNDFVELDVERGVVEVRVNARDYNIIQLTFE